jgi:hypothetical protein
MSIADDLQKLEQLRSSGSLSEAEFEQAKKKLLGPSPDEPRLNSDNQERKKFLPDILDGGDNSLGQAANRYVTFHIVMGAVAVLIFLFMLFFVVLPQFNRGPQFPGGPFERIEWKRTP